ncbi:MAG: substrate-binding periplasmic protein [Bdellovibrionales bacterium]
MKILPTLVATILSAVLVIIALPYLPSVKQAARETAYERVMRTQTLRCGYGIWEPAILRDPNTGVLSGWMVDIMDAVAREAQLKVEWTEEVDWGQIGEALQSGRVDAMCAGIWATAGRGKIVGFTDPLAYTTIDAFVREGDTRFDADITAINDPAVRIAINDGDVTDEIARRFFPKAQRVAKPQIAGETLLFQEVVTNKADVTFTTATIFSGYNKIAPGTLRRVAAAQPLLVNANVIGVSIHDPALQNLLNSTLRVLHANGAIREAMAKWYAPYPEAIRLVPKPHQ